MPEVRSEEFCRRLFGSLCSAVFLAEGEPPFVPPVRVAEVEEVDVSLPREDFALGLVDDERVLVVGSVTCCVSGADAPLASSDTELSLSSADSSELSASPCGSLGVFSFSDSSCTAYRPSSACAGRIHRCLYFSKYRERPFYPPKDEGLNAVDKGQVLAGPVVDRLLGT